MTVLVHRSTFCFALIAVLASPSAAIAAGSPDHTAIESVAYTRAQQLVSVEEGRRLNLYCSGDGLPVVIFDSGLGDSAKAWGLVQPVIAQGTKACSYDRAGLGFSDPSAAAGTSENAVRDLHQLLIAAELPKPVILVGHSYGGMNVKLYAETFPTEVAGLVLVDPSHEDLGKEAGELDPDTDVRRIKYLEDLQRCLRATASDLQKDSELNQLCVPRAGARYSPQINSIELEYGVRRSRMAAWISEMTHVWAESADQVRAAYRSLGAAPVYVLTKSPSPPVGKEAIELRKAKNAMWIKLHNQIAGMSSRGERITVPDTGHYIQHDQPRAVIDAIQSVLQQVTEQTNGSAP